MTKKARKAMSRQLDRTFDSAPDALQEEWDGWLNAFSLGSEEGTTNEHEFDPYDVTNLFSGNIIVHAHGRVAGVNHKTKSATPKIMKKKSGLYPVVYEQTACFRYALPS
ncbi:MAG: hypothetical protein PHN75_06320 [Syntrophales bacterium]|nr:hypothetical protein [Syntrophales bacterium]